MFTEKKAWGLMVAATVTLAGLAGCASPLQSPALSQAAAQDTTQVLAASMLDEQDIGDYDYMLQAARGVQYSVAQAEEAPRGRGLSEENKERLEARLDELRAAVAARLAEKAESARKVKEAHDKATESTDADGNRTRSFSFEDERTTGQGDQARSRTRSVESTVTVSPGEGVTVSKHSARQTSSANGNETSREFSRTREVQQDGSVVITFHRSHTFKDGRVHTAYWTKTISAEGGVSGSGAITLEKKDGTTKTIELTFGGTVDATTGQGKNDDAEVTLPANGKAYGKGGKPVAEEGEDD